MKRILLTLLFFNCAVLLEAVSYQNSVHITPLADSQEYLVDIRLEKLVNAQSAPELIASPQIICTNGKPAVVNFGTDDKNQVSINVLIQESREVATTSFLVKENNEIVYSSETDTKIG